MTPAEEHVKLIYYATELFYGAFQKCQEASTLYMTQPDEPGNRISLRHRCLSIC